MQVVYLGGYPKKHWEGSGDGKQGRKGKPLEDTLMNTSQQQATGTLSHLGVSRR